ncbi:MAG: type I DNA topoisomerase [Synergistaceae bacterium]|nr:type I DNA topoisomerase [Synergistaceae bacterium]
MALEKPRRAAKSGEGSKKNRETTESASRGKKSDGQETVSKSTVGRSAEKSSKAGSKPGRAKPKEIAAAAGPKTAEAKTRSENAARQPKKTTRNRAKTASAAFAGKTLIIVESPAKAHTLEKILGRGYHVEASIGHVRDLPKARIAVDVDNNFAPEYINVRGKASLIKSLKAASIASKRTLLASDPDREGEAISWHLASILGIDPGSECRIRMQEITEQGVKSAVKKPERIDMNLVDAQQSRRVLDRLVGYNLSPLLWYKVQRGLSAGRVQSVALRIVCEREDEIDAFVPKEYWLLDVEAASGDRRYLMRVDKKNKRSFMPEDAAQSLEAETEIRNNPIIVGSFKVKETKRPPLPPFKTSVLQQEASRRLGFSPRKTMRIAQSLYEGVDIPGRGPVGLITYMRTDSLRLAPVAIESSRKFIEQNIGREYLPDHPNIYTPKGKAQDAHEAIRATDPFLTPESLKQYLRSEQFRLYELIWNRFIASQMEPARVARTTIEASSGEYGMKQSGIIVLFQGWGKVWPLGVKDVSIPPAEAGERLELIDIKREQKFTQPPARYTDAGLVKVLEEKGIGRPSTYASIVETIADRGYVVRDDDDNKKLVPTKLGRTVNVFLVKYFPKLINLEFTAKMESELDSVESGEERWVEVVRGFWESFKPVLDEVSATAERMQLPPEEIGEDCPECGHPLVIKRGRFGEFIACSGYPNCKYTRRIIKTIGIKCPKCGEGEVVRRKASKGKVKGRTFYACARYPNCDFTSWVKPAAAKQPDVLVTADFDGEGEEDEIE